MSTSSGRQAMRFAVLTRLHELQLEEARIERTTRDAEVERQRRQVERIESDIADSHALSHELVAKAGGVAAEILAQLHTYLRWLVGTLAEQRVGLTQAEMLAEQARVHVVQRFERLAAIERFQERQVAAAAIELTRSEQRALDDQAPVRAALCKESAP